jgi:hypothetical protein
MEQEHGTFKVDLLEPPAGAARNKGAPAKFLSQNFVTVPETAK